MFDFDVFNSMFGENNRFFKELFSSDESKVPALKNNNFLSWQEEKPFFKDSNLVSHDKNYDITIHVPVVGDSLDVTIENNRLIVSWDEKKDNFHTKGSYSYTIPDDVDIDKIDANLNENRLVVTLPKKEKKEKTIKVVKK